MIEVFRLEHLGVTFIGVRIPKQPQLVERIRRVPGRRWSYPYRIWVLPYEKAVWASFRFQFPEYVQRPAMRVDGILFSDRKPVAEVVREPEVEEPVLPHEETLIRLQEQLMLRRYSVQTRKTYLSYFRQYLLFLDGRAPDSVDEEAVRRFVLAGIQERRWSEATQNQAINAVKFYYEQVLKWPRKYYEIDRPKRPVQLPSVLSEAEVTRLLNSVGNLKHHCLLLTVYSAGLRLSEVVNLRLVDILEDRLQLLVKGGKGKKDRYTVLSPCLLERLQAYREMYRPRYWLFEGQLGDQYAARSVQSVFRKAARQSGINPHATLHWLRHSFATHLLERGTDLRYIQHLLGHASSKTTERYTHVTRGRVAQLVSPLEFLKLEQRVDLLGEKRDIGGAPGGVSGKVGEK